MSLRVLLYSRVNPADGGGVQAVFTRLGASLRAGGHSVVRAWRLPNPDGGAGDVAIDLPLLITRGGVPTPRSIARACRAAARLAASLSRYDPGIVNCHYVTAESVYFLLLRPFFGYKVVLSIHGSDLLRPKPWDAPLLPWMLRRADAITTVSSVTAARARAVAGVDPARVRLIPNGVDHDFWSAPAGGAAELARRAPVLLSVGRLHPVKGHDVLLQAFARVRQAVEGARLVIVGEGAARPALELLAAGLKVAPFVQFTGAVDAAAVRGWMGQARAFVQPSRSEGLPLALLEAMAAGLPVVATRVGGVPEVAVPGTGVLVPPEDPEALAAAMVEILLDHRRAADLGRDAKERARRFSASVADGTYEALFLRLRDGTLADDDRPQVPAQTHTA